MCVYTPCEVLHNIVNNNNSFGSPVLATSLELILVETKFSSLKTDVMMTANS